MLLDGDGTPDDGTPDDGDTGDDGDVGALIGDDSGSGSQDGDDSGDDFDKDRALKTIRKLRGIEKSLSTKLKAFEDKDKTDAQKARDDLKATRQELADAKKELAAERVRSAAAVAGMHNPKLAANLIDLEAHDNDADAALKALKKSDPYLFKGDGDKRDAADSGGGTNPRRGYQGKLTIDQIRKMGPEEFSKRESEINAFLASQ